MLEPTVRLLAVPAMLETILRLDEPSLLVTTEAVTPRPAEPMAVASVESVLSEEMVRVVAVPEPTWMEIEPVSVSLALVIPIRVALEAVALVLPDAAVPAFTVALSVVLLAAIVLSLTVIFPSAPEVPETRLKREPDESLSTEAVMPTPEALIVEANSESVLSVELSLRVNAVPEPTCSVIDPESVVEALGISAR